MLRDDPEAVQATHLSYFEAGVKAAQNTFAVTRGLFKSVAR